MKRFLLLFLAVFALASSENVLTAKTVIHYSNGPHCEIFKELPDSMMIGNEHVDFGIMYKQFSISSMPLWNYGDVEYVFLSGDKKSYWTTDDEDLNYLRNELNIEIPEKASPSLWNKIGMKPLVVLMLMYLCWKYFIKKEDEDDNVSHENASDNNGSKDDIVDYSNEEEEDADEASTKKEK